MPADIAFLDVLLDHLNEGVYVVDRDGRITTANWASSEPLDFRREGPGGEPGYSGLKRLLSDARPQPFVHESLRQDGRSLEIRGGPTPEGGFVIVVTDVTERRRLLATEELLKQALDHIADGFAVFDAEDRIAMMNKLYVGYSPEDADGPQLGTTFEALMQQDRRHRFYPDVVGDEAAFIAQRIAAHREGKGRPVTFRTSDGRWAQARDYRLPDGGTVTVRTDISELVERDRSLRESQANLAAAQRIARLGSWELDLTDLGNIDRNPLRWSDETFRIFGYEPNQIEMSNDSFFRAVHPDDRDKVREAVRRAIDTGVTYSIEHRVIRPDGREIIVHEKSDVIFGPSGRPVKMVGTVQDITEQRAAERTRDEYRTLLEVTSEASPDGILVTDSKGRYLFWNKRLREMWNLSDDYLAARLSAAATIAPLLSAYTDQVVDPEGFIAEITRIYDRGEPPTTAFADIRLKDGRVFDRHAARVDAGKLPYSMVAWIYRDVTEQRKRDAALAQTQRLNTVGELSGGMAHELNNLLMVIGGNLELIEAQDRGAKERPTAALVETARSAVGRSAELIKHLLTFSRRQPLLPKMVDLNSFIADMMNVMSRIMGASVAVKFVPGRGLWPTVVDPGFLQTTLVSLATNARDAMPDGGSLVIETSNLAIDETYAEKVAEVTAGEYALITFTDDGTGMPPEAAKRAFEPFFTTKPVGQGTGLGLSVVYGFVKQSGGHVGIDSKEGRGTSVRIYLPRATAASVAGAGVGAEASTQPMAQGNKERILLVEDDAPVLAVARAFLSNLGYQVLEASNGREALGILRSGEPIDLLFTDVVLPDGMNGAEIARAAEKMRPGLKVLFASGHTQDALIHQGRLETAVTLLPKPYRKRDLAQAIRALLSTG